jgi:ethanolamine utilization protein EutN
MLLAKVVGTVVTTQKDPSLEGMKVQLIQPLNDDLQDAGDIIAAVDVVGAGSGELVWWIKSREASLALPNTFSPVDATITGIVDEVDNKNDPGIVNKERIFQ